VQPLAQLALLAPSSDGNYVPGVYGTLPSQRFTPPASVITISAMGCRSALMSALTPRSHLDLSLKLHRQQRRHSAALCSLTAPDIPGRLSQLDRRVTLTSCGRLAPSGNCAF
jgi:hypothetical protein